MPGWKRAYVSEAARATAARRMQVRLARRREIIAPIDRRALLLATAAEFRFDVEDMIGGRRFQALVTARAAFALLSRRRLGSSATMIGRALGGRDHTTILNALLKGESLTRHDHAFVACLARIEAQLWPQQTTGSAA